MKMTEDEAIAYLRTFNAWRCGDESQEAPTPSAVTEAIRTVCDALEGARRAVPDSGRLVNELRSIRDMDMPAHDAWVLNNDQRTTLTWAMDAIAMLAAAPAQPAPMPWPYRQQQSAYDRRMVDIVRHLSMYPATRADEMTVESIRAMCRDAVAIYDEQPATETAGDARDAELIVHRIARALAVEDGYDPDDKACGLYDLRWSGGTEPEPVGDAFTMDYLPRAERIAAIISAKTGV